MRKFGDVVAGDGGGRAGVLVYVIHWDEDAFEGLVLNDGSTVGAWGWKAPYGPESPVGAVVRLSAEMGWKHPEYYTPLEMRLK